MYPVFKKQINYVKSLKDAFTLFGVLYCKTWKRMRGVGVNNYSLLKVLIISIVIFTQKGMVWSQSDGPVPVSLDDNGELVYLVDEKGDRIPDFSFCGYRAREKPIPDVPIKVVVPVEEGDNTRRIQSAIDYVAGLPLDENGFRGTILLAPGIFKVEGGLKISNSGVVLRGSGMNKDRTIIVATGKDRRTLITIQGEEDKTSTRSVKITDTYVPVNAQKLTVEADHNLTVGDEILIQMQTNQKWVFELGMNHFGGETDWLKWKPGERDLFWVRTILNLENNTLTLDAPVTCAIDSTWGGGVIWKIENVGRISNIGIENVQLQSAYDTLNMKDEQHAWMAVTMNNVNDAWVRQVTFYHFASSTVAVFANSRRVTVEDCKSLSPVSEIGGQRRFTYFTEGQQVLFQRCYAEHGYHDFATGFCAAGPNAFVQCESYQPYNFSGAIDSWSAGTLFDIVNVKGHNLSFRNRESDNQGAGWCAANSVFWQCTASKIECYKPPTAQNWAFGNWAQYSGNGYWHECNSHIEPRSFYYAQLADRLGKELLSSAYLMIVNTKTTSSPSIELAEELTKQSNASSPFLKNWIDKASQRQPVPTKPKNIKSIDEIGVVYFNPQPLLSTIDIKNGWLTHNDSIMTGSRTNVKWWRGDARAYERVKAVPHLTRYVPGRNGTGVTDDINEVVNWMEENNTAVINHNYGLWYDRRRDDHQRVQRGDGEVWPPFYELPFARSGKGTAWDGLSKYDLTKYNSWYWMRLKQYADMADHRGLLLFHQNYFQHNILEAGAHWADFPWRAANNINKTGFPEPPPYAGDKRIFMAGQFYDISHPIRRELHKSYIRKCLDNFAENQSVIQFISAEYTGPLHFVEFWIDVIKEWEQETGKDAKVALSTTKDVQDAILSDPQRSVVIDVIDIRYWSYRADSSLYAQPGGINLAPRQYARLVKPGKRSFDQVYRSVREYKEKYPEKAVIYSEGNYNVHSWAVFMAGGSLASIPDIEEKNFYVDALTMYPDSLESQAWMPYVLKNKNGEYIIYNDSDEPVRVILESIVVDYNIYWIDPANGKTIKALKNEKGGEGIVLDKIMNNAEIIWITEE